MNITLSILMDAFFIALLLWCSYTDIRKRTVSNANVILLLCLGIVRTELIALAGGAWWTYPTGMVLAIPFFLAWLRGRMGAGDIKLVMTIGLYLGLLNTVIAFALIVPILAVFTIHSWIKTKTLKGAIPLAPVLAFGSGGAITLGYIYTLLQF